MRSRDDSAPICIVSCPLSAICVLQSPDLTSFLSLTSAMPPKGGNAKKETGRAKKAENEASKKAAAAEAEACPSLPHFPTPSL
jgi:hypothetical protein